MKFAVTLSYYPVSGSISRAEIKTDARNLGEVVQIIEKTCEDYRWLPNRSLTVIECMTTGESHTLQGIIDATEVSHKADVRALKLAGWIGVACVVVLAFAIIFAYKGYLPLNP